MTLADYNRLAANYRLGSAAAPTLVAALTEPAATVPPFIVDPGPGGVSLEADVATGRLYLVGHDAHLASYDVSSNAGALNNAAGGGGGYATLTGSAAPLWELIGESPGSYVAEGVSLGQAQPFDLLGPGLRVLDLNAPGGTAWVAGMPVSDLLFSHGDGTGDTFSPAVLVVPEPPILTAFALSSFGLAMRVRRRK